jgi:methylated-DNA-[protein]-cysteine S-methyltransferase
VKQFHSCYIKTKVGIIKILCDSSNLLSLNIVKESDEQIDYCLHACSTCESAILQLQEYFNGQRKKFDLPIAFHGSELQVAVWSFLRTIPYGATISYSQVAHAVNCKSVRAVATIIGKNPVPIIVPCHRVIRKDGTIGEFSLVGPELKKQLLELERTNCTV